MAPLPELTVCCSFKAVFLNMGEASYALHSQGQLSAPASVRARSLFFFFVLLNRKIGWWQDLLGCYICGRVK